VGGIARWWPRARSWLRRSLWWLWPDLPTSWAELPARLRPAVGSILRLTVAAVVAYLIANLVSPGILDLTAPLTALLVVQASTVGTLRMGIVRVGAVLTGVLVAVGLATSLGLSWWSLALVIAASLLLAKVLRLGEQSLEAPISAMLILAVSSPAVAAEVRVVNTLIGTAVGILFSLVVPVAIPNAAASETVRRVARSQAALLNEIALTLREHAPHPAQLEAWLEWVKHVRGELDEAGRAVRHVEESRRLNPRALAVANVHPRLRAALDRLDRCLAAERALLVIIEQEGVASIPESDEPSAAELRRVFAVVLDHLATALRAFGDLVRTRYGGGRVDRADEARERTAEGVREARAVLTELTLLDIDPRRYPDLWMLQGTVLAAVEQILRQLDLEHVGPDLEARRPGVALPVRVAWPPLRLPARTGRKGGPRG
jgi:uncharacterized membrane protein YccC